MLSSGRKSSDVSNSFIIPKIKEISNILREDTTALPCADISLCFLAQEQKRKKTKYSSTPHICVYICYF